MENKQEGIASQTRDAQWQIETLNNPETRSEAQRRLNYLRLMPKLSLSCLVSDLVYLGYRSHLAIKAPSTESPAYVVLLIEFCCAGKSLKTW